MGKAIRVRDWTRHFEKADLRKVVGVWRWVPMPIRHDGNGWRRLCALPNKVNVCLGFMLIIEVAAKMPVRGLLANEHGELEPTDLSITTGMPAEVFSDAFIALTDPTLKINWLEWVEIDLFSKSENNSQIVIPKVIKRIESLNHPDGIRTHCHNRTLPDLTEPNHLAASAASSEPEIPASKATAATDDPSVVLIFPTVCSRRSKENTWGLTQEILDEFTATYTACDVLAECKKSLQWIKANPKKMKTIGGMRAFLVNWLSRAQDRGGSNGHSPRGSGPDDLRARVSNLIKNSGSAP